ncbi:uncharacterized protein LOC119164523 isoform X3 [Rhipicephalus microplus]|uniref:uncharacterized protein LOC119164523 isoform X3 n=1 Tax=Rhipicephalus microplus TaxID=6941 RepID=UPI003F6ABEBC
MRTLPRVAWECTALVRHMVKSLDLLLFLLKWRKLGTSVKGVLSVAQMVLCGLPRKRLPLSGLPLVSVVCELEVGMSDKAAVRRARKAAAARARRQDPNVRAREAEAARKRREADPKLRAREAEAARNRRQADPELRAREAAMKRELRQAHLEAARAREAAAKRLKRSLPKVADTRLERDISDRSFGHSCKVAVPPAVMQRNAASRRDQSTSCEVGLPKSTQVKIPTPKICRRMQTNGLEGLHKPSSAAKVPFQSKAVFLVPRNSRGVSCAVHEHAKVNDSTEGDCRIKMDANKSCNVKKKIPPSENVCFVVGPYGCGVCSRSFTEVDALFSHVMVCPWPEPSQCGLCSEPCASWGAVLDHLAVHVNMSAVKCPLCELAFGNYLNIRRHIQRHHMPVKPFVCNCCDSTFITKWHIRKHSCQCRERTRTVDKYLGSSEKCDSQARSHLATAVYRCSICPSAFLDRLVIARHMRVHLNEVQQSVGGECGFFLFQAKRRGA